MSKKLKITTSAKKDIANILEYLNNNWSSNVTTNFITIMEPNLKRISEQPGLFPYLGEGIEMQRCVITKHNTIFFKEYTNHISIVCVFDVRQHPMKRF